MTRCPHSKPDGLDLCASCMPGEVERLYDSLLKYGNHLKDCPQRGHLGICACTCGFRKEIAVNFLEAENFQEDS